MTATLPPLPVETLHDGQHVYFTSQQMRAYAQTATEAAQQGPGLWISAEKVQGLIAAAVAEEREACSDLCDEVASMHERTHHNTDRAYGADACAEAIRARKDTE